MNDDTERAAGHAVRVAGAMAVRGAWWVLKAALGPVLPAALGVGALGLLVVALVTGFWQRVTQDAPLVAAARTAAAAASGSLQSYDGAEAEHRLPWTLVAAVVGQAWEEGNPVTAEGVAEHLAPRFAYEEFTVARVTQVRQLNQPLQERREEQVVRVLKQAETYLGVYTYTYMIRRREQPEGWVEEPVRESIQCRQDPERLITTLAKLLNRLVAPWEARWVMNLAGDLDSEDPGQWVLAEDPDTWLAGAGMDWHSTWQGTPAGGKVAPLERPLVVTSPFGSRMHPVYGTDHFHTGVDLAASLGTPVRSAWPGRVQHAGPAGGYGLTIVIDHGQGIHTVYAHLSQALVAAGREIPAGVTIGLVGSTGISTGPHLHYEVRQDGKPVDPLAWLTAPTGTATSDQSGEAR